MHTQINARLLKAVAFAASTEAMRYYLNGVLLECTAAGVTYVATDGHVLLAAHEALPKGAALNTYVGNIIVPSATIKALSVKGFEPKPWDLLELEALPTGEFRLGAAIFRPIDGSFPDWRRVIPQQAQLTAAEKDGSIRAAQLDPRKMEGAIKAANLFGRTPSAKSPFKMFDNEAGAPQPFTFCSVPNMFGVVMPVRRHNEAWGVPSWAQVAP
jgi:hypothetical protein